MFRYILLVLSIIILVSCVGSQEDKNNLVNQKLSFSINNISIDKIDVIHPINHFTIKVTNTDILPIKINSVELIKNSIDHILTIDCDVLQINNTCNIDVRINGIYTYKTTLEFIVTTDNIDKVIIKVPVWNYNWQNTKLNILIESHEAFTNNRLDEVARDIPYTLLNTNDSPLYIESLTFLTASNFNKLDRAHTTCGGPLLGHASCILQIDYHDIGIRKPILEQIIIGAKDSLQEIEYMNYTKYLPPEITLNCKNLGICQVTFKHQGDQNLTLESFIFLNDPHNENLTIMPSQNNGCEVGIRITNNNCNFTIAALKIPVNYETAMQVVFRYYLDTDNFFIATYNLKEKLKIHINNLLEVTAMSPTIPALCKDKGGSISKAWSDGVVEIMNNDKSHIYHVHNFVFTPSATNYEDFFNKKIITSNVAILNDTCTNKILNYLQTCQIHLQAGCNGYGSAGELLINYTIDDDEQLMSLKQTLSNIEEPDIELDVGYGIDVQYQHIWHTLDGTTINPIHVVIPIPSAGFNIGNFNWATSGMYTKISENYDKYKELGIPDCFGQNGMDMTDDFYPSGLNPYCGISMNFTQESINTSIPISLWLGNHAQNKVDVIFEVQGKNYKQPLFKGAIQ